jgi:hypothetical protein
VPPGWGTFSSPSRSSLPDADVLGPEALPAAEPFGTRSRQVASPSTKWARGYSPGNSLTDSHSISHTPHVGEARYDQVVAGLHCPSWASSRRRPFGANQDSPDPEGAVEHPEFQQLATLTRVRVTRCRSLLAFMRDFAVLYSLKCQSLLRSTSECLAEL